MLCSLRWLRFMLLRMECSTRRANVSSTQPLLSTAANFLLKVFRRPADNRSTGLIRSDFDDPRRRCQHSAWYSPAALPKSWDCVDAAYAHQPPWKASAVRVSCVVSHALPHSTWLGTAPAAPPTAGPARSTEGSPRTSRHGCGRVSRLAGL